MKYRLAGLLSVGILSLISIFFLFPYSANAATRTWSGTTSNLWNLAANWGGTLPVAGDDLVFPLTPAGNKSNSNNFTADTSFNSITINGTGYTLAGNRIKLAGGE